MNNLYSKVKIALRKSGNQMSISDFKETIMKTLEIDKWSQKAVNFVSWLRKNRSGELEIPLRLVDSSEKVIHLKPAEEIPSKAWIQILDVFLHAFNSHVNKTKGTCVITRDELDLVRISPEDLIEIFNDHTPCDSSFEITEKRELLIKDYKSLQEKLREKKRELDLLSKKNKKEAGLIKDQQLVAPNEADQVIVRLVDELNAAFETVKSSKGTLTYYGEFPEGAISDYVNGFIKSSFDKGEISARFNVERSKFIDKENNQVNNEAIFYQIQGRINQLWRNRKEVKTSTPTEKFEMNRKMIEKILTFFFIKVYELEQFKFQKMEFDGDNIIHLEISTPVKNFKIKSPFILKSIINQEVNLAYNYVIGEKERQLFLG